MSIAATGTAGVQEVTSVFQAVAAGVSLVLVALIGVGGWFASDFFAKRQQRAAIRLNLLYDLAKAVGVTVPPYAVWTAEAQFAIERASDAVVSGRDETTALREMDDELLRLHSSFYDVFKFCYEWQRLDGFIPAEPEFIETIYHQTSVPTANAVYMAHNASQQYLSGNMSKDDMLEVFAQAARRIAQSAWVVAGCGWLIGYEVRGALGESLEDGAQKSIAVHAVGVVRRDGKWALQGSFASVPNVPAEEVSTS